MAPPPGESLEHQSYRQLRHWRPLRKVLRPEEIIPLTSDFYPFFAKLYAFTRDFYSQLPQRKNGEITFIHPVNAMYFLRQADTKGKKVDDIALTAGLLHDYVEESVDIYRQKKGLQLEGSSLRLLDQQEKIIIKELQRKIEQFCQGTEISLQQRKDLLTTVALLTRHKQHSYYVYISVIFNTQQKKNKERAIYVKLADRIHNVLCIESFNERERIYQCFKNMFLLNNVKKYLLEKYGPEMWNGQINNVTEKLFNKCIKATHDGLLHICHNSLKKGILPVQSMLEMAFHKYSLLNAGFRKVTELRQSEPHLVHLYQGIVRKYDTLLHREREEFRRRTQEELEYCHKFFQDYHFSEKQLHAIIDYKDAFALKEILAHLLYEPKYFMSLFVYSELSKKGRILRRSNH